MGRQRWFLVIGSIILAGIALAGALKVLGGRREGAQEPRPGRANPVLSLQQKEPATLFEAASKKMASGEENEALKDYELILKKYPDSEIVADVSFILGEIYEKKNDPVKAREYYQRIIQQFPVSEFAEEAKRRSEDLNVRIIASSIKTPDSILYEVQKGDMLGKIAKQYNTTTDLIILSNGLKSDLIKVGQKLKINTIKFTIIVDKSQNILTLKGNQSVIKTYPVATGANNSTPVGNFTVITKVKDPTWYRENAVVPPGSSENILGSRWIGISQPGYGIHGSVDPQSIGRQVTAGCVRLHNKDVEELYSLIPIGTEVEIID